MLDLAKDLNARVRGDEGETYRSMNDWYIHPDDQESVDQAKQADKKRKISPITAIVLGLLLGLLLIILF